MAAVGSPKILIFRGSIWTFVLSVWPFGSCGSTGKAAHAQTPFQVGFPLESRRFVHVLDEMTVDLMLEELDTVPDLVG